jgi:hypothetical protein
MDLEVGDLVFGVGRFCLEVGFCFSVEGCFYWKESPKKPKPWET